MQTTNIISSLLNARNFKSYFITLLPLNVVVFKRMLESSIFRAEAFILNAFPTAIVVWMNDIRTQTVGFGH